MMDLVCEDSSQSTVLQLELWLSWFIDCNSMLTGLELFYAKRLENRVHRMFAYAFAFFDGVVLKYFFFTPSDQIRMIFKHLAQRWKPNWYYHSGSSGSESNGNEGVFHTVQISRTVTSPSDVDLGWDHEKTTRNTV